MNLDFRQHPALLEHIVDTLLAGIFTVDAQGCFVAWNRGAERITGYSQQDLLGQPCSLLEGANCKGFAALTELMHATATPHVGICQQECKLLSKDGREVHIHGNLQLLYSPVVENEPTHVDGPSASIPLIEKSGHALKVIGAVGCFMDVSSLIHAHEKIEVLERQATTGFAFEELIGNSEPMQQVFRRLKLAADSDVTALLIGESGTGKELAARAIHKQSERRHKPFMAINCAAIPTELLESELFGHVKGAFTGATSDRAGLFEVADGGTLFLDEIGDVSPAIQVKLLRVLQEREIRRVGESAPRRVDVRLITATHRDLMQMVNDEKLREDFYYRIHVFAIRLPPLRERREDIPLLVDHFIRQLAASSGLSASHIDGIARDTLDVLVEYHWPGNVRELRNAIEHATVLASGDRLSYFDLPPEVRGASNVDLTACGLTSEQAQEKDRILQALRQVGGNRTKAATALGTSRVTLWKKISRYGIEI
ncbi:MAG: sigma 54-interacting transcriptional regulator [Pirellulaceae bacterium]|jgi:two-component system response regulator HydG